MRLAEFIAQNKEPILQAWEDFARDLWPAESDMDIAGLRDHAAEMLDTFVADIGLPQSKREKSDKSIGLGPHQSGESSAERHASDRLAAGYTINQVVSEFRALRASVLKRWAETPGKSILATDLEDVHRFNEAIDQALSESVKSFSLRAVRFETESRRMDEFLAMLAHELRNPLAPISSAAYILQADGVSTELVRKASGIISRQVVHMSRLVNDLLEISRVKRGLVTLEKEVQDIKPIVTSGIEQARALIETRGQVLTLRITAQSTYVDADRIRMAQVISNLLNNAARYTQQNGKITVQVEVEEQRVRLSVTDNGMGMDAALLPHVFELFSQGERSSDRVQGGLGIGLALVKTIVERHGGTVEASSAGPGLGSTFRVLLPLCEAPAPSFDRLPSGAARGIQARSVRVMAVDDNQDAANALACSLRLEGHQVNVEYDGMSALKAMPEPPPQVFVLDIGLPGIDGYELARQLRAHPGNGTAILVALTGYGQTQDRVLSTAAGFDHHFVKPVDMTALRKVLVELD